MSSRQLIKCFFPTLSTEPLQAHTPLILEFYYRSQTSLCFDLAAQPALSVPARLPLEVVDTAHSVPKLEVKFQLVRELRVPLRALDLRFPGGIYYFTNHVFTLVYQYAIFNCLTKSEKCLSPVDTRSSSSRSVMLTRSTLSILAYQ